LGRFAFAYVQKLVDQAAGKSSSACRKSKGLLLPVDR
jgi:hypothetical protein